MQCIACERQAERVLKVPGGRIDQFCDPCADERLPQDGYTHAATPLSWCEVGEIDEHGIALRFGGAEAAYIKLERANRGPTDLYPAIDGEGTEAAPMPWLALAEVLRHGLIQRRRDLEIAKRRGGN